MLVATSEWAHQTVVTMQEPVRLCRIRIARLHVAARQAVESADLLLFVLQMGSGRNFCIDIVLLCIVLAIALYIYNAVKTKSLPGTTG